MANFTNVQKTSLSGSVLATARAGSYPNSPYASKGGYRSQLTEKERLARKVRTSSYGGFTGLSGNTTLSNQGSFFSPQLSTDFLELPQSLREKREIYRHFYNTDPIVGQAIDLHTELPLSKVRLSTPKPRTCPDGFESPDDYGKYILDFFERMCSRIKLFQRLLTGAHHYWLDGNVFFFAEDSAVDIPESVGTRVDRVKKAVLGEDGNGYELEEDQVTELPDREERELAYFQKHYQGWSKLIILPIDQVKLTSFSFTDKVQIELIPSDRDRALFQSAMAGDENAQEMVQEIPQEVREYIESGKLIPLGTDPDEGSFCYHLAARRGAGEELGASILDRCHISGTKVVVERSGIIQQVPIESLNPETDRVLSDKGAWRRFEVGRRHVSEDVVRIKVAKTNTDIQCTKEHKYRVIRKKALVELPAEAIEAGDYIQIAQIPLPESLLAIEILVDKHYRTVQLDQDLGYVIGFWLGHGFIEKERRQYKAFIGQSFRKFPQISKAIKKQLRPFLDSLGVDLFSEPTFGWGGFFARWLAENFGFSKEDKHLPAWVFETSTDFLKSLLRGYCDSNGSMLNRKDGSSTFRFHTTNLRLMDQLFLICTSLGFPASEITVAQVAVSKNGVKKPRETTFNVQFTHAASVKELLESGYLCRGKQPPRWTEETGNGACYVECGGKLFYRVRGVTTVPYTGLVYSLNVHVDHSFFAGMARTSNCLRTLYYREKLRQAQTQIASRAMTPKRLVWGENLSESDTEDLREQVDLALIDPDYSIVTNYEVHWEEIGSRDRLLDLSGEYETTDKQLFSGLGVTESLLNGEATFGGDRVKLEVLNTRYLLFREINQEYVEENLFKPVARRKGFVEKDKWGNELVLYPKLSFTRLALRDSQDTYDALFNLYQKGSISIDLILEMFNIDPSDTRQKIEKDMFSVNDSTFNEVIRGIYSEVGRMLAEKTDIMDRIAKYLGLQIKKEPPAEEEGRF